MATSNVGITAVAAAAAILLGGHAAAESVNDFLREQQAADCAAEGGVYSYPRCIIPAPGAAPSGGYGDTSEVRRARMSAGREMTLSNWHNFYRDCVVIGISGVEQIEPPRHGVVSYRTESFILGYNAWSGEYIDTLVCEAAPTLIPAVFYRADAGFRGVDRMRLLFRYDDGVVQEHVFEISVE